MPPRPARPSNAATDRRLVLPDATIALPRAEWFERLAPNVRLRPGVVAPKLLRIPEDDAQTVLRGILHLVADIRADAPPTVVWVAGRDELLVLLDQTRIACAPGMLVLSLVVRCDELRGDQRVEVPFAVGTPQRPTGLVMSTFDRVQGPALIADAWSESITAFAWEAVVTMAQQLAAATGDDAAGRPLVPALVSADRKLLLVAPMARTSLGPTGVR